MYHGVYHLHRAGIARCAALSRVTVTLRGRNISPFGAIRSSVNYETSPSSLVNSFPVRVQPYLRLARLDRPIGSWLLFWPCAWSIGLASDPATIAISLGILGKFGLGTVVMRGAGCTINDLWDRDFDKQVSHLSSHHHQLLTAQCCPHCIHDHWLMATSLLDKRLCILAAQLSVGLCSVAIAQPIQVTLDHCTANTRTSTFTHSILLGSCITAISSTVP